MASCNEFMSLKFWVVGGTENPIFSYLLISDAGQTILEYCMNRMNIELNGQAER